MQNNKKYCLICIIFIILLFSCHSLAKAESLNYPEQVPIYEIKVFHLCLI